MTNMEFNKKWEHNNKELERENQASGVLRGYLL